MNNGYALFEKVDDHINEANNAFFRLKGQFEICEAIYKMFGSVKVYDM
jgi:hypothetical protein